jgi:hypothetical protein
LSARRERVGDERAGPAHLVRVRMEAILRWVRAIVRIGVLTFLSKLGWRAWVALLVALAALVVLVGLLLFLVLRLMF